MKRALLIPIYILAFTLCTTINAQLLSYDPQSDANTTLTEIVPTLKAARVYANKSVLAEGKWVKISIETSGIKMLTHSALKQMGFQDPAKVAIYGNGGKELPLSNSAYRVDDLNRLPVYRTDNAILFYAEGVGTWSYNSRQRFKYYQHRSSSASYYFVTEGEPSEDAELMDYSYNTPKRTINTYDYRSAVFEREVNLLKSGSDWWARPQSQAKPSKKFTFKTPQSVPDGATGVLYTRFAIRDSKATPYKIAVNGAVVTEGSADAVSLSSTSANYASLVEKTTTIAPQQDNEVELSYNFANNTAFAWSNQTSIVIDANLDMMGGNELMFRKSSTYTKRSTSLYEISGAPAGTVVWDITSPTAPMVMASEQNGDVLSFVYADKNGSEFIAFSPKGKFEEPKVVGAVANQDLHGMPTPDYVIVTHPSFLAQAQRLADLHRTHSGLTVAVAVTDDIYNEFSSGKPEAGAIRDFLKMLYDRGDDYHSLQNALLFGTGNYDMLSGSERNKIPVYESAQSLNQSQTYVTDDFYGWLGNQDGVSDLSSRMRIGVGRFPVITEAEAKAVVDKSEIYLTNPNDGAWRNRVVMVADDGDKNEHLTYADKLANVIEDNQKDKNVVKVYIEAYAAETTSTGIQYPKAISDFTNYINNGCVLINYVGHGGATGLSDEKVLPQTRISSYTNPDKLAFFITATCDFAPFDNWGKMNCGEECLMAPNSGFLGLLTTTRLVFGDSNYRINNAVLQRILDYDEKGEPISLGEAVRYGKVQTGSLVNSLKYALLGDPALSLRQRNVLSVSTDSINGEPFEAVPQISALQQSEIIGTIRDKEGNVVDDFNGQVAITLYDKKKTKKTNGSKSAIVSFEEYSSTLYNGMVNVVNGRFEMHFSLSKDIDVSEGYGRISYYACSADHRNATGASEEILIGGIATDAINDTVGPDLKMWIDYPSFANGGITGSNPILYAHIEDPSGVNTSGAGIGHDLRFFVDGDKANPTNINNLFVYEVGSSTKGNIAIPLTELKDGKHSLTIKAWDNNNNSSMSTIDFVVNSRSKIRFENVQLYPQPTSSTTDGIKLRFCHNEGNSTLKLTILLYSMDGSMIGNTEHQLIAQQTQTEDIQLCDILPQLRTLPRGIYLLKVKAVSNNGREGDFSKKLIIAQ